MPWIDAISAENRARIDEALEIAGSRYLVPADGDQVFAAFLLVCDAWSFELTEASIFALADYGWRDAHEGDLTPREAVRDAVESDGLAALAGPSDVLDTSR